MLDAWAVLWGSNSVSPGLIESNSSAFRFCCGCPCCCRWFDDMYVWSYHVADSRVCTWCAVVMARYRYVCEGAVLVVTVAIITYDKLNCLPYSRIH